MGHRPRREDRATASESQRFLHLVRFDRFEQVVDRVFKSRSAEISFALGKDQVARLEIDFAFDRAIVNANE